MGKTVPGVLSAARGRRPCSRPRAQFFLIRTDLGRQIMCLFFSVGNYFLRNICVDFLLKQFHTVRVRLTFRIFFVWIIKFTFAMIAVTIRIHRCFSVLQKAAKIAAILKNSERSVRGVRMGKSGPL